MNHLFERNTLPKSELVSKNTNFIYCNFIIKLSFNFNVAKKLIYSFIMVLIAYITYITKGVNPTLGIINDDLEVKKTMIDNYLILNQTLEKIPNLSNLQTDIFCTNKILETIQYFINTEIIISKFKIIEAISSTVITPNHIQDVIALLII